MERQRMEQVVVEEGLVEEAGDEVEKSCDMRTLRRALKFAKTGTGEIARVVEKCNFDVSARGFTMLIAACRRSGRWKKAMEIFEAMSCHTIASRGVKPNFYTYSSLISVCCNADKPSKGLSVFKTMVDAAREAEELEPDFEVYRTLISSCSRAHRAQDVLYVYKEMITRDIALDSGSKVHVINALFDVGDVHAALEMLNDVHMEYGTLSIGSYTSILECCANNGISPAAVEVFLAMQMMGVEPTGSTCHEVMRAAASSGDFLTCLELLHEMSTSNLPISPSTVACALSALKEAQAWQNSDKVPSNCKNLDVACQMTATPDAGHHVHGNHAEGL